MAVAGFFVNSMSIAAKNDQGDPDRVVEFREGCVSGLIKFEGLLPACADNALHGGRPFLNLTKRICYHNRSDHRFWRPASEIWSFDEGDVSKRGSVWDGFRFVRIAGQVFSGIANSWWMMQSFCLLRLVSVFASIGSRRRVQPSTDRLTPSQWKTGLSEK